MEEWQRQGAGAMITNIIGEIEKSLEIKFEDDVISWIGNEFAFVLNRIDISPQRMVPLPEFAFMLKVDDKAKAKQLIEKLIGLITANFPEESGINIEIKDSIYKGSTVTAVQIPIPMMGLVLSPGYSFADDFLMIAMDTKLINSMIDAKTGNTNILTNKHYLAAAIPARTNSTAFINVEQGVLAAKDVALWAVNMAEAQGAGEQAHSIVNEHVIPILDILGAIRSVSMYQINAGDRMEAIIQIKVKDLPAS